MKLVLISIILPALLPRVSFAEEFNFKNQTCESQGMNLSIEQVLLDQQGLLLNWNVHDTEKNQILISGQGYLHKEVDSADAFSAFDNETAISFKNNKAVFVLPNGQAFLFQNCH